MPRAATRYLRGPQPASPKRVHPSQPTSSPRKALEQTLANKPVVQPLQDSDDSDKLVVRGAGGRRGSFLAKNEIYASGAVGKGDKPGSHPTRAQRRKQMMQARHETQQAAERRNGQPAIPNSRHLTTTDNEHVAPILPFAPSSAAQSSSAHPTPSNENSVLDGIRPRRRQHSILQPPELEDSSAYVADSFALPDDESTPLNLAKSKAFTTTPSTSQIPVSPSRKRKRGSLEPVAFNVHANPDSRAYPAIPSPEATLPPQSFSSLRKSGQKQRGTTNDDDTDIMAPPISSSSSASPTRSKTCSSTKPLPAQQTSPVLTEQLQILMPTKRRKTNRARTLLKQEFDIPSDSSSAPIFSEAEGDSLFRPTSHKPKRPLPQKKATNKATSEIRATKSRQKQSKAQPTITSKTNKTKAKPKSKGTARSKTSTRLTPSRSAGNQGTKSPSQQAHNIPSLPSARKAKASTSIGASVASSGKAKRSGGSHSGLKGSALADISGKENMEVEGENEVPVERSDDGNDREAGSGVSRSPLKKNRSMWDEIDDWDMDFEEVEVWERSSEKNAR